MGVIIKTVKETGNALFHSYVFISFAPYEDSDGLPGQYLPLTCCRGSTKA